MTFSVIAQGCREVTLEKPYIPIKQIQLNEPVENGVELLLLNPSLVVTQTLMPEIKKNYPELTPAEQRKLAFSLVKEIRATTKQKLIQILQDSDEYDQRFSM